MTQLTGIINLAGQGSKQASNELLPLVYDELRRLAEDRLRHEPANMTLQATALVHEAYLRLGADAEIRWEGRRHYFGAAAIAMRRILIERARARAGPKRGGGRARVPLTDAELTSAGQSPETVDWLALEEALSALERTDPDLARIVELRYFAGLSVEQVAGLLGVSARTVNRDWRLARAFLHDHLTGERDDA
ncbi:MAG: sigma-70 family RNA polymerase sigma factor [Phycisphaerae bacterium]|nr:sigma-70 family RNA polymerase sigma factor [Phycisphaerae bacterium]